MSDDLLARATRALRQSTEPHSEGMDAMLARLSPSAGSSVFRRPRVRAWGLALAATFVGLGGWAGATGRLPVWAGSGLDPAAISPAAAPPTPSVRQAEPRGHSRGFDEPAEPSPTLAAAGSSGRMLLDARYNRAIALVRVGRASEAEIALRPFAEGQYGGYRREEARKLMESLGNQRR